MSFLIRGFVDDHQRAQEVVAALGSLGLARERIHVMPLADGDPEHGSDAVSSWSAAWGSFGLIAGAAFGWVLLAWTPVPWIGSLWCAVVGGICGARFGGYRAYDATPEAGAPSGAAEIRTEAATERGATEIERVYVDHGAHSVVLQQV